MRDIKAMLPEEIAAALAEMGQPNTVPSRSSSGLRAARRRLTR